MFTVENSLHPTPASLRFTPDNHIQWSPHTQPQEFVIALPILLLTVFLPCFNFACSSCPPPISCPLPTTFVPWQLPVQVSPQEEVPNGTREGFSFSHLQAPSPLAPRGFLRGTSVSCVHGMKAEKGRRMKQAERYRRGVT